MRARDALRVVCEAWERGDPDEVARLFAADGRYEDPLLPGPLIGPDAVREGVAQAMAEVTDLRIPIRHLLGDGDVAICEASFLCRPTEGEGRLDFEFAMVVETRDGEIARLTEYFDTRPLA